MSPAKVTFCQVRIRAVRSMSALPMSVSVSTMTPGGGEGGGAGGGLGKKPHRAPQSLQSVPSAQSLNSEPAPPGRGDA